jgi:hypothetical protein
LSSCAASSAARTGHGYSHQPPGRVS